MKVLWDDVAWNDFCELVSKHENKLIKKIMDLLKDIDRNGANKGAGKPERLKYELSDYYSREISGADRLVYRVDEEKIIHVVQCKTHYHK